MLVLMILAVVWAAVLVPPILRSRRDGRPSNSVLSFRAQLSTLERAMPGTSLRIVPSGTTPALRPRGLATIDVRRRRRDVLASLAGATVFTLLLAIAVGGLAILLFLACAGATGGYVYLLRQIHLRSQERAAKVRPLVPRGGYAMATGSAVPGLALRRSASN